MAFKLKRSRLLTPALLLVIVITGGWLIFGVSGVKKLDQPEYLSFQGNYVFSVPKGMAVDAHLIQGMQLVYSGSIAGKTIDQIYTDNNVSLQPLEFIKDKKGSEFKEYINDTLVPEQKQKLAPDVVATFVKKDGQDVAKITVKKDSKPLRFIYIQSGPHPVSIVSKEETDNFKKIEQSVTDVKKTDLKNDAGELKQAAQTVAQQIRDKKADDLYKAAAPELRTKNVQDEITKLLAAEEVYSQGLVTINGGSYANNEFGAVIHFMPLNTDFKPASGAMYFKKIDNQWKLTGLQLPNPAANKKQP